MINQGYYNGKLGKFLIEEKDGFITKLNLISESKEVIKESIESPLINQCKFQLEEYFSGKRKTFDIPLAPKGTEFQRKVWKALTLIPYGSTCSYKDIAEGIGCNKGYRAVGMANNKNPIMIIIPCHRVIGANGKLTGYAGGLDLKEELLKLEGKYK